MEKKGKRGRKEGERKKEGEKSDPIMRVERKVGAFPAKRGAESDYSKRKLMVGVG